MQTFERNSCVMVTIWSDEKRNIIGSNISDKINELKQRDPYAASIYLLKVNIRNTRKGGRYVQC